LLADIKRLLDSPSYDMLRALKEHHQSLVLKRHQVDALILNVERSIAAAEGRICMEASEKFEGLKQRLVRNNEEQWGREARARYGDEAVDASCDKIKNMSPEQHEEAVRLSNAVEDALRQALVTRDPESEYRKMLRTCTADGLLAFGKITRARRTQAS
jgi:hypothetical protein